MGPAQGLDDRSGLAIGREQPVVTGIGVSLQDAGEVAQMLRGMIARAVSRSPEQHGRRIGAAEGPVVADIDPSPAGVGLALRQDRHRRIVAMKPFGRHDMLLDQAMERPQGRSAGADMVGQRRERQIDAFAGIALALPVQRLVLAILLEQDHRQQIRPGMPARDDVERRR